MSKVIRILCGAMGDETEHDDRFIKDVKFDADPFGGAVIVSTEDRAEAIQFDGVVEAMSFWKTQSHVRPLRPDGEANRPLTAFTVTVE